MRACGAIDFVGVDLRRDVAALGLEGIQRQTRTVPECKRMTLADLWEAQAPKHSAEVCCSFTSRRSVRRPFDAVYCIVGFEFGASPQ
jgi:hypothetical protein